MTSVDQFANHSAIQLATEAAFISWVKCPDAESDSFWKEFLNHYPMQADNVEKARSIVRQMRVVKENMNEERAVVVWDHINTRITDLSEDKAQPRIISLRKWMAVAAVLIIMLGVGGYFLFFRHSEKVIAKAKAPSPAPQNDIAPGGNKAILTLADGRKVILDTANNGAITKQGSVTVIKLNGQLAYSKEGITATEVLYNTITTPKGGQYQLVLADGTKVWLNAASSLRFPTAFVGSEREVQLTGEGYFEVAHNASMPFHVKVSTASGEQEDVQVLGTHFNINAYSDEPSVKTTLLEGRVMVKKQDKLVYLNPGQQAIVQPGQDNIRVDYDVDLEEAVAWKNGLFVFNQTPLENIMRQIERWYKVDVVYQGDVPQGRFNSTGFSRNTNLSDVLKVLEYSSNIRFRISENTLTVLPQ